MYDSILFSLNDQIEINEKVGYTFFPLNIDEPVVVSSFNPFKKHERKILPIDKSIDDLSWKIDFEKPISISDNTFLYINMYTENIDALSIWIKSDGKYFMIEKGIEEDYFQFPEEIPINKFKFYLNDSTVLNKINKINQIVFSIHKKKDSKKWNCILGDIKIYDLTTQKVPAKGLFFYELTKNEINHPQINSDRLEHQYLMQYPTFKTPYSNIYHFQLSSIEDQEEYTLQLLYHIINKYPYFSERQINKDVFLSSINSILKDSTISFKDKINSIDLQINSIGDPHFSIERKKERNIQSNFRLPLTIMEFTEGFYVTAVNDCTNVKIGTKIQEIEGTDLRRMCDSLRIGKNELQSVLNEIGDKNVTMITDQGEAIHIQKQEKVAYPSNYYKPDRFLRIIDDHYLYFSLNNWKNGDYLYFTNQIRNIELNKIKGVIFDLRNNGGGYELECMRFLSMFIDKPCVYNNESYLFHGEKIIESLVVSPNSINRIKNKQVVILINGKTACASEIFIANMKKYASTVIIGQEKTSGAYAEVNYFNLPYDIKIKANVLEKKEWIDYQIENKGIVPDMYVYSYETVDLYPHNDKVLKQAIKYLKNTKKFIPNKLP